MSRSILRLTKRMQELFFIWDERMRAKGIPYMVTSIDRNILEQMALYVQGRLSLEQVNSFRSNAGLYLLESQKENLVVTWTLNSKHVTNMFDEKLNNDFSRAFDYAILKGGKPTWEIKVNVGGSELPDYEEAGRLGEEVGLVWGGNWNDPCHLEGKEE